MNDFAGKSCVEMFTHRSVKDCGRQPEGLEQSNEINNNNNNNHLCYLEYEPTLVHIRAIVQFVQRFLYTFLSSLKCS